jgi:hypothetical protein
MHTGFEVPVDHIMENVDTVPCTDVTGPKKIGNDLGIAVIPIDEHQIEG